MPGIIGRIWQKLTNAWNPSRVLLNAARAGDTALVHRLIEKGVDANHQDSNGVSALVLASVANNVETVRVLLDAGADLNIMTDEGWGPYDFAKNLEFQEVTKLLLDANGGAVPYSVNNRELAFLNAARDGNTALVLRLLEEGVDISHQDANGLTALALASSTNSIETARALLDAGADLNIKTNEGWGPYDYARSQGFQEITKMLLDANDGVIPHHDYRAQAIKDFDPQRLDVYRQHYGEEVIETRPFYNIGAGHDFHPVWQNVDHWSEYYAGQLFNNLDVDWDIAAHGALPVDSDSALAVYTSHTIEHIRDEDVRHLFSEARRILEPGGYFRVTCPNIDIYYKAAVERDEEFELFKAMRANSIPFEACLINEMATQLRELKSEDELVAEFRSVFAEKGYEEAMNHFTSQIDFSIQQQRVGMHINWWNPDKIARFLSEAGFEEIEPSSHGNSACPAMRDTLYFDKTDVKESAYVEARKSSSRPL